MDLVLIRYGRNYSGTGQNLAQGFIALKPWDVRTGKENSADAIQKRAMKYFSQFNNAQINVTLPASVNGLGQTDGLDLWIQDLNGQGQDFLDNTFRQLQTQSKTIQVLKILISNLLIVKQISISKLIRNKH